jgi:hypothetical protein
MLSNNYDLRNRLAQDGTIWFQQARKPDRLMPASVVLDSQRIVQLMVRDLSVAGVTPLSAVHRAIHSHLFESFSSGLGERLLKPPVVKECGRFDDSYATLHALAETGHDTWYTEVIVVTRIGENVEDLRVTARGLELIPMGLLNSVQRSVQIATRTLKRQTSHAVRINHLRVPGRVFHEIASELNGVGDLQPLVANFSFRRNLPGYRTVAFDNMLTGSRVFCHCARRAHKAMWTRAEASKPDYSGEDSWAHEVVSLLKNARYAENVCHLCLAQHINKEEPRRRYGASIADGFEDYIDQLIFDEGLDARTARERVKQILGLDRWVKESTLYTVIRDLFPQHRVLREASPTWLGRMRFDIFLPELALAIEYQGQQHYQPVAAFGGDEGYLRIRERDAEKRRLCQENGVNLMDVRYDAPLTAAALRQRLRKYLVTPLQ